MNAVGNAILAGLAATIVSTVAQLVLVMVLVPAPFPIAWHYFGMSYLVAGTIGSRTTGGLVGHFVFGSLILPLFFLVLRRFRLPGGPVLHGAIFGLVIWAFLVSVLLPGLGAGRLLSNQGGIAQVIALLVSHLLYGGTLGWGLRRERAPA